MTLESLEARVAALEAQAKPAPAAGAVADDRDLDSQYGDPTIRFGLKERYWPQPDEHIGRKFSECEPEYLDATAKYLDACAYMARKNATPETKAEAEKKAGYKERDAARARGWAARIRKAGAPYATAAEESDSEGIPF